MKELTQLNLVDGVQNNEPEEKHRDIPQAEPINIRILQEKVGTVECAKLLSCHKSMVSLCLKQNTVRKTFDDLAKHILDEMQAERGFLFFMVKIEADRAIQFKKWLDDNKIKSKSMEA